VSPPWSADVQIGADQRGAAPIVFLIEEVAVACDPKQSDKMATQSRVGPIPRPVARPIGRSRRFVTHVLPLGPIVATLAALAASLWPTGAHPLPGPIPPGNALRIAISGVMDAATAAASAADTTPGADGETAAVLEDAWATLAQVLARFEAQQSVAEGRRPPLMTAPPPLPAAGDARDRALAHSAARYVHAALETHDLRAAQRAIDLLALRSDSRH
jgi:hypothetical protein